MERSLQLESFFRAVDWALDGLHYHVDNIAEMQKSNIKLLHADGFSKAHFDQFDELVRLCFNLLVTAEKKGVVVCHKQISDGVDKQIDRPYALFLREAEGCFLCYSYIAVFIDSQLSMTYCVEKAIETLTSGEDHVETRLKALMHLYNRLCVAEGGVKNLQNRVFLAIFQYADAHDQFEWIIPDLASINYWIRSWDVSKYGSQEVLSSLHDILKKRGFTDSALTVLKIQVARYNDADEKTLASQAAHDVTVQLVVEYLRNSDTFYFDNLLKYKAVEKLKTSSAKALLDLVHLFIVGTPAKLQAFWDANSDVFTKYDLSFEKLVEKMRLVVVASAATPAMPQSSGDAILLQKDQQRVLSTSQLAEILALPEQETEDIVVDAISLGLMEARVSQLNKNVVVKSGMRREFGRPQWELLNHKLKMWHNAIGTIVAKNE